MAVPELGQIRIIPDWFNQRVSQGVTVTTNDLYSGYSGYEMFDHRSGNLSAWNVDATSTNVAVLSDAIGESCQWMLIIDGHNMPTANGLIGIRNNSSVNVAITTVCGSGVITDSVYFEAGDNNIFAVETVDQTMDTLGISIDDKATWADNPAIGICHLGKIYEMPTNAQASLSYNTKFQNKVQTAFSGASYSTLYNTNPQRIIKASWEYINWSTGSSGIDDFSTMMNQCYGSHIPVALQLSQETPITSDYFMFARITKWNQTQMSPTLWKVSAEFTEFI